MQHVINVSKWNGTRKKDTRTFGNYKLSMHPSPGKTLKPKVNVLVPEDDPSVMEMDLSPPVNSNPGGSFLKTVDNIAVSTWSLSSTTHDCY